jgi:fructokinase
MIICAGESLIDMVSFKGEPEYTPHVGGSNFNSSIALGRLGADSYYFGAVSNDSYGELIENTLRHSEVKEDFVIKTNRPTTLAYADVVNGIAEYTFVVVLGFYRPDNSVVLATNDLPIDNGSRLL